MPIVALLLPLVLLPADTPHALEGWQSDNANATVGQVAPILSVSYHSPQFEPAVVRPVRPIRLPDDVARLRLWCARLDGDFDLVLLVRDARGMEHAVRTFTSRPAFPAIRRFQMADWSIWHQVESVNLAVPSGWEDRVLPEYREAARRAIWPRPLTFSGIRIEPARQRRDNEAYDDAEAIAKGQGRLCLADWDARSGDGLAARYNWFLDGRWRWGWDRRPCLFLDDLTRRSGSLRYAVEVQQGYQGPVVWRTEGSGSLDRSDAAAILANRIELPELPAGRYWVTTKTWISSGVLDTVRSMQLWVAVGPPRDLPVISTPLSWETGQPEHVFPSATTSARLVLHLRPDPWNDRKDLRCVVRVADWRNVLLCEGEHNPAETVSVECPGVREGTDYLARAEILSGNRVLDRADLHFGVASPKGASGRQTPDGIPTRDELLMSRRAVPVAEHFGSLMSPEHERAVLTPDLLAEFDQWLRQAAGYGFQTASFCFGWGECEPLPGVYRWDEIERRVRLAEKLGMKMLLTPAAWGDSLEYPRWLSMEPMLDQYGYVAARDGLCEPSFWAASRRAGQQRWLKAVAERFLDDPAVIGYRTKSLVYADANQPEFRRTDYSRPAQETFGQWLAARGNSPGRLTPLWLMPGCGIDRFGPDLSEGWRSSMAFRTRSYVEAVQDVLSAIRSVDPIRQVHVYRGSTPTACEAAIPLLRDGAEFHDEGGPFYFQRAVESLCLQAGVPYTNEGHQFTPPSIAMLDSTLFYGSCFDRGWYWLYRWNIHRSEDRRFAALPKVLTFLEQSLPAQQEWVSARNTDPEVLVFGSRADRLLGNGRHGFYSNIRGIETFTALFSYHQVPAQFADEYADWVDLGRFKLVFAVGDILSSHAMDRLIEYARGGGKLVLVGDAGRFRAEQPTDRDALARRVAGLANVRRIAAADQKAPPPGPADQAPADLDAAKLEEILAWAGVQRQVWTDQQGFECLTRFGLDKKTAYVALFRRWPGRYENIWYDQQVADRWPPSAAQVSLRGLPDGAWRVEKLHRTPRSLGTVRSQGGLLRFQADPAGVGELQVFRLSPQE